MTTKSLKSLIPEIAEAVGLTPAALYERQRALVRAGLLESEGGRGPGSGVRVSAESAACLMISLLATDSLSETEKCTRDLIGLVPKGGEPCAFTGKSTFGDAMALIVGSSELVAPLFQVRVIRPAYEAIILHRPKGVTKMRGTYFEPADQGLGVKKPRGLITEAVLTRGALKPIMEALAASK